MARCVLFNRTINAIIVNQPFIGNQRVSPDNEFLQIKPEPLDTVNDDHQANVSRTSTEFNNNDNQKVSSSAAPVKSTHNLHDNENAFAGGTRDTEENGGSNDFEEKRLRKRNRSPVESGTPSKRNKAETTGTREIASSEDKRRRRKRKNKNIKNLDKKMAAYFTPYRIQEDAANTLVSNDALFACDICSITFETTQQLQDHKSMYAYMPSKYECRVCPTRFNTHGFLMEHVRCFHANIPRTDYRRLRLACSGCNKSFYSKHALQPHIFHNNHQDGGEHNAEESHEESVVSITSASTISIDSENLDSEKATEKRDRPERDSLSTPSKKMRQMMLTDYFPTSPISPKPEPISPAKITNFRKSSSSGSEPTIVYTTALVHRSATPDQDRRLPSTPLASSTPQGVTRPRSRMLRRRLTSFSNRPKTGLNVPTMKTKNVSADSQTIDDGIETVSGADSASSKDSSVEIVMDATPRASTVTTTNRRKNRESQGRTRPRKCRVGRSSKKIIEERLRECFMCKDLSVLVTRYDAKASIANVSSDVTVSDIIVHNSDKSNLTEPNVSASNVTETNITVSNVTESNVNAADVTVPNISATNIIQPNINTPHATQSNINIPDTIQPKSNASAVTKIDIDTSNVNVPTVGTLDVITTVTTQSDVIESDSTQPNTKAFNIAQPNVSAPVIDKFDRSLPDRSLPDRSLPDRSPPDRSPPARTPPARTVSYICEPKVPNTSTSKVIVPDTMASEVTARSSEGAETVEPSAVAQLPSSPQKTSSRVRKQGVVLKSLKVCVERLSPAELSKHIGKHQSSETGQNSNNLYKCKICDMEFNMKRNRRKHVKQAHTAYMSVLCKSRTDDKAKLVAHYLQDHSSSVRSECCVCQQSFPTRRDLKRHLFVHCIRIQTTQRGALVSYTEMRCDGTVKKYKCTACGKIFKMFSALKEHRSTCALWEKMTENNGFSLVTTPTKVGSVRLRRTNKTVPPVADASDHGGSQPSSEKDANVASVENETAGKKKTSTSPCLPDNREVDAEPRPSTSSSQETLGSNIEAVSDLGINSNGDPNVPYPCAICGLQFQTMKSLWNHKRTYLSMPTDLCSICGTAFPSKRFLRMHIANAHKSQASSDYCLHCRYCGQSFVKRATLRMHEAHFHSTEQGRNAIAGRTSDQDNAPNFSTMCTTCHIIFTDYDRLVEHNTYYYGGHDFPCTFCDQSFKGMYMLHHHNKMAHYPKDVQSTYEFRCDICNEGFKNESHYFAHKAHVHWINSVPLANDEKRQEINNADDRRVHACPNCHLNFPSREDLLLHQAEFSNQGSFACDTCERQCHTLEALITHRSLTHDDGVGTRYRCPTCNEGLPTEFKLLCHQEHFHRNTVVPTNRLGKHSRQLFKTIDAPSLEHQKRGDQVSTAAPGVPTDGSVPNAMISAKRLEELNGCAPIEKDISVVENGQQDAVADAGQSPSKVKLVQCTICNALYNSVKSYRRHRMQYMTKGNFQCKLCPRRFILISTLKEHMAKHNVNMQWQHKCPVCNEGFKTARLMSMHILHLHPSVGNQSDQGDVENLHDIEYLSSSSDFTEDQHSDITFVATETENQSNLNSEVLDDGTLRFATDPLIIDEQNNDKNTARNFADSNTINHNANDNNATDHLATNRESIALETADPIPADNNSSKFSSTVGDIVNQNTASKQDAIKKPTIQETVDHTTTSSKSINYICTIYKSTAPKRVPQQTVDQETANQNFALQKTIDHGAAMLKVLLSTDQESAADKIFNQRSTDHNTVDGRVLNHNVQNIILQRTIHQKNTVYKVLSGLGADQSVANQKATVPKIIDLETDNQNPINKNVVDQKAVDQQSAVQKAVAQKIAVQKIALLKITDQKIALLKITDQKSATQKVINLKVVDQMSAVQNAVDQNAAVQKIALLKITDQKFANQKVINQKVVDQTPAVQKAVDQKAVVQKSADHTAAVQKAVDETAAVQKAVDQKAAVQKSADHTAAVQKAVDETAAVQKAVVQKAVGQKATGQNAVDEKAAVQKAVDEKAAVQKTVDQKVAVQMAAGQNAVDQKAAIQNAVSQKPAVRKALNQKTTIQKAVDQKAAVQKAADHKAAVQKAVDETAAVQKAVVQKAVGQKATGQNAVDEKAAIQKAVDEKAAVQKTVNQEVAVHMAAGQNAVDQKAAIQDAVCQKQAVRKAVDQTAAVQNAVGQKPAVRKALDQKTTVQKAVDQKAAVQDAVGYKAAVQKTAVQKITDQNTAAQRIVGERNTDHNTTHGKIVDQKAVQKITVQKTTDQKVGAPKTTNKKNTDHNIVDETIVDQNDANQKATVEKVIDHVAAGLKIALQKTTDKKTVDRKTVGQKLSNQKSVDENAFSQKIADQKAVNQTAAAQEATVQKIAHQKTTGQKTVGGKTDHYRTTSPKPTNYSNTDKKAINLGTAAQKTSSKTIDQSLMNLKATGSKTTRTITCKKTFDPKACDSNARNPQSTHNTTSDQPKEIPLVCLDDSDDEVEEPSTSAATTLLKQESTLPIDVPTELLELSCGFCPAKYQNVTDLQTHLAVQHRDSNKQIVPMGEICIPTQSIPCVLCNSKFSTQSAFKKHLLTVHLPCIRIMSNESAKSSSARVVYRLQKTSATISYLPNVSNASTSSTTSNTVTASTSEKLVTINSDKSPRIAKLKVRSIVDIAANITKDKKSPLPPVGKNKIIRLLKVNNTNNTCVSGQPLRITNSANVTPRT